MQSDADVSYETDLPCPAAARKKQDDLLVFGRGAT
jgi:hypothetical protein